MIGALSKIWTDHSATSAPRDQLASTSAKRSLHSKGNNLEQYQRGTNSNKAQSPIDWQCLHSQKSGVQTLVTLFLHIFKENLHFYCQRN